MPRRKALKEIAIDLLTTIPEPETPTPGPVTETPAPTPVEETPEETTLSLFIPVDKLPDLLADKSVGEEVTLKVTGSVSSKDDTGMTIDITSIGIV